MIPIRDHRLGAGRPTRRPSARIVSRRAPKAAARPARKQRTSVPASRQRLASPRRAWKLPRVSATAAGSRVVSLNDAIHPWPSASPHSPSSAPSLRSPAAGQLRLARGDLAVELPEQKLARLLVVEAREHVPDRLAGEQLGKGRPLGADARARPLLPPVRAPGSSARRRSARRTRARRETPPPARPAPSNEPSFGLSFPESLLRSPIRSGSAFRAGTGARPA